MACSRLSVFRLVSLSASVCLCPAYAGGSPEAVEYDPPIVIRHAKVVTGLGDVFEPGVIVIERMRIAAVGPEESTPLPEDALILNADGLIAYPGFVDAGSWLGIPDRARTAEERQRVEDERPDPREGPIPFSHLAGRRGIRPEFRALDAYTPSISALDAHRQAGFTAALITPRPGILRGRSELVSLSDAAARSSVLVPELAQHASFEVGEDGEYPGTLLGVIALLRQTLLDAQWHGRAAAFAQRHPQSAARVPEDAALEALREGLARRQPWVFEANSDVEIRRALALASEFDLKLVISGAREAWKVADLLREKRITVIASVRFDEEPEYGREKREKRKDIPLPAEPQDSSKPPLTEAERKKVEAEERQAESEQAKREAKYESLKARQERRRLWEEQVSNLVRLHEAGVTFALRTSDLKDPTEFWTNVRRVMDRGLPESAVISALGASAAEILTTAVGEGTADVRLQLGAIAPQRLAHVTLMTAPISDPKAKVRYAFVDGRRFDFETPASDEKAAGADAGKTGKAAESPQAEIVAATSSPPAPGNTQPAEPSGAPPAQETSSTADPAAPELNFETETEADRIPKTHTGGSLFIKDATVIPVSGPTLPRASILVENGKISRIGRDLVAPQGVPVIDGVGRFVIPGFVDPHSHLGIDAVNEAALSISSEVRIEDVINPNQVGIYLALAGGTTSAHIMHGSANTIGGQCDVIKHKYRRPAADLPVPDAPPTIKFALGENVIQSNFQPVQGKRFPNSRTGVEVTLRRAFEAALEYDRGQTNFKRRSEAGEDVEPVRRDLRLEALASVLHGDIYVHCHCYRSEEILRFLGLMEEYGVRVGVLQHVLDGYRIWPEIARHGCGASTFATSWAYKIEANEAIPQNAAILQRHGICSTVNSDSPDTIRYLGQEAAKSMRWGGLTDIEALRLVTLDAARQLHVDHRLGSLDVGKDADLAIFNGHPMNSFSKCVMTLIEGEVYFEDDSPASVVDASSLPMAMPESIPVLTHDAPAYAIINATLHPMSGPVIERGVLIVRGERIVEVGSAASLPPDAEVYDAAGMHVYPGLIDAGTTVTLDEVDSLRATNMSAEIGVFQPDLRAASAVYPFNEHVRTTRASGITTVLAYPRGADMAGQSAIVQLDGWTASEMSLSDSFGLHVTLPTLPLRTAPDDRRKTEDEHRKRMQEWERLFEQAAHYASVLKRRAGSADAALDRDPRLEAMAPFVAGDKPTVFHANTYQQIVESLEFAKRHRLKAVIFGGREAWKLADRLAHEGVAVIHNGPTGMPGEFEPWDSVYACAGVLDRAGVEVAFGSGSADLSYTLPIDVGLAVAHGMRAERAEFAMTLGAARLLGLADRIGSIEVGKQADLIISTGSPLQASSRIAQVFLRGRPLDLSSRQTRNLEMFSKRPAPSLSAAPSLRGPGSLTRAVGP